ncbi:uncharacterized protein KY384_004987 [Bacidia gigantensis]|uniref:uncharacterized protein n=1 Tax=Bacidia gigantensis TaxID=2732470 RepID=UPI001D0443EA|nr:uncharacterized protein KY384_004987 [Bacidia gigantensis]KAG8530484.1 hypothetical protein KY384_004987 [Bacidia gigantensis]
MDLMFIALWVSVLLSPLAHTAPQDVGLEPNSTNGNATLDLSVQGVIGGPDYTATWGFVPAVPIPGLTFCMVVILALCDLALADYNEYVPLPMEFRYPAYNGMSITVLDRRGITTITRKYVVIALFYLLKGAAEKNACGQGTFELYFRHRLVALIHVDKHESLPPTASPDSSDPIAEQLNSSSPASIVDIEHYNYSSVPHSPKGDIDLAQEPSNTPFRLYYNFYGSSFPVDKYFITLAFGLARLAEREVDVVLTQVDESLGSTPNHLLLTSWQHPPRTQPPFFLNGLAVRGLCKLAKVAVKDRKFQEVEAVIEMGPQTPVGIINMTRIESAQSGQKGAGNDIGEQVEVL